MSDILNHALAYAAAGWPVFPCNPKTKRPLLGNDRDESGKSIPNTGGLKKASTDENLVRGWWKKWPKAMIGVPTGLSRIGGGAGEAPAGRDGGLNNGCGFFVVDLDIPKEISSKPTARQTCIDQLVKTLERMGDFEMPETTVSITGSGGWHMWFAMPEGQDGENLGNRAAMLDKRRQPDNAKIPGDVDVRGNGGYVIVPPSVRSDGESYQWEDQLHALPILKFVGDIGQASEKLLDLILKRGVVVEQNTAGRTDTHSRQRERPARMGDSQGAVEKYALAALDREVGELANCGEGGRNHALNRAAFSLGTLISAGALSQSEVEAALMDAAGACGLVKDDGLPSVEKTIASGLRGGIASPRDLRDIEARPSYPARGEQSGPVQRWQEENEALARQQNDRESISGRAMKAAGLTPVQNAEPPPALPDDSIHEASYDPETGLFEDGDGGQVIEPPEEDESGGDSGEAPAGRDGGLKKSGGKKQDSYSTTRMNKDWALVLMGAKAVVIHEQPNGPIEDRLRVLTVEAFGTWFANRYVERVQPDGKSKAVTWAKAWMTSRWRRQYKGLVFLPDPEGDISEPEYLNLWRGFEYKPDENATDYTVLRDHLLNNVCRGDDVLHDWVFGWFAHMFQRPRERTGTALVFRGKMGAGKSVVGEVMGSLIGTHFFMVDDPRYITGQFNAHMASCLLLQAEEAVWAGDKAAEGRLKGLITSKYQMIEAKGIDPIKVQNFVRLMMTSNEDWVVPAGKDERRFCVLDVDDRAAQNHTYFAEMFEELDNGGRERLLHDLLTFDLDSVDLWTIPKTYGLLEQKIRSLDSVESWWFERLMSGEITRKSGASGYAWPREIPKREVFEDYINQADTVGVKRKSEEVVFGMKLKKLVPSIATKRPLKTDYDGHQSRVWCYLTPPLEDCRGIFEGLVGQEIDWPDMENG